MQRLLCIGFLGIWLLQTAASLATPPASAGKGVGKGVAKSVKTTPAKQAPQGQNADKTKATATKTTTKKTKKKKTQQTAQDKAMAALPQVFSSISAVKSRLASAIEGNDAATTAAKSKAVDELAAEGETLGALVGSYSANLTIAEKALGAAVDAAKAALDAATPTNNKQSWETHTAWDSLSEKRIALGTAQRQLKKAKAKDARLIHRAQDDAKSKLEETADDLGKLYLGDLSQGIKDAEEELDENVDSIVNPQPASSGQMDEDPALLAALQDSGFGMPTTTTAAPKKKPAPKKVPKKTVAPKKPSLKEAFASMAAAEVVAKANITKAQATLTNGEAKELAETTKKSSSLRSSLLAKRKALQKV